MKRYMDRVPIISRPQLFDRVIADIQRGLADNLAWLDHSFGRAWRLSKMVNGRREYTPNVYIGNNEYLPVMPDEGLGNFSFFVLSDPQDIEWSAHVQSLMTAPFSLIVWVDVRTITDDRNTEQIKAEILDALGRTLVRDGSFEITRISEHAENVYKGYTLDEVDNQFLMHPFAGFRFDGVLRTKQPCM